MRGKHSTAAAARRARVESDLVNDLQRQVTQLKAELAAANSPVRTEEEKRLSLVIGKVTIERDEALSKVSALTHELDTVNSQLDMLATSYARAAQEEDTPMTMRARALLIELGYEPWDEASSSRQLRRISKGSNLGYADMHAKYRDAHPGVSL